VALGIRPEHLHDAAQAPPASTGRLRGRVVTTELLGSELLAHVEIEAKPVLTQEVREVLDDIDRSRVTELEAEARATRAVFVGRFEPTFRIAAGADVEIAVDTRHLHFFDLTTEEAIGTASTATPAVTLQVPA
jgi:multiple sugar transport system ATP-binding protein